MGQWAWDMGGSNGKEKDQVLSSSSPMSFVLSSMYLGLNLPENTLGASLTKWDDQVKSKDHSKLSKGQHIPLSTEDVKLAYAKGE
jgi:hypothetical protein